MKKTSAAAPQKKKALKKEGRRKVSEWRARTDEVVYGPSAIMTNFHTCGILLQKAAEVEESERLAQMNQDRWCQWASSLGYGQCHALQAQVQQVLHVA